MVVLGITHPGKWERESLATPIHFNNEGKDSTSLNKVSLPEENNKIKRLLIGKVFIIISSMVEPLIMYSVYYILSPSLHTEQSMAIASISVSSILSSIAHASLTCFCFVSRSCHCSCWCPTSVWACHWGWHGFIEIIRQFIMYINFMVLAIFEEP